MGRKSPTIVSCSECCGALEHYDKAFDRITTRNEKQLKSIKRIFHTVTTTDDPVIRKVTHATSCRSSSVLVSLPALHQACFCSSQLAKTQGNVFATDAILATLMCCTRSVNSWDIIVQRVGNKLFFDKRDNSDFGEFGCSSSPDLENDVIFPVGIVRSSPSTFYCLKL